MFRGPFGYRRRMRRRGYWGMRSLWRPWFPMRRWFFWPGRGCATFGMFVFAMMLVLALVRVF